MNHIIPILAAPELSFALGVTIVLLGLFAFGVLVLITRCFRKVQQGTAMVITGLGGPKVEFSGCIVWPVIQRIELMDISVKRVEIYRHGSEGLICKDNVRADIKVAFFVRVNNEADDVLRVAQSIGCARASSQDAMIELFDAKFSEALKTVGKQFDFTELYSGRERFKIEILKVIGTDLNGYVLDDAAIDYLEQTPMNLLDPNNILDSEGIKKITDLTAKQQMLANHITREKEKTITKQNVEAREAILELERQQAEAEEKQRREVSIVQSRERAESAKVGEEERLKAEKAKITVEEELAVARQNMERQVIVAQRNKERTDQVEIERVERDRALEATERERIVTLAQIARDKAVEVEKKNIQDVIRERVTVERAVVEQEEKIKDTREFATAERHRQVEVVGAETLAQQALVKEVKAAEAQKQAAQFHADEVLIASEAKRAAAEKESQAKKMLAEAAAAEFAAQGLAEAEVIHAKAAANLKHGESEALVLQKKKEADALGDQARAEAVRKLGESEAVAIQKRQEAEAAGLRARMNAEAEGITEKAEAMKKLDGVGKEHEEFKLRLDKEKAVDLAGIQAQADIASSQAQVVSEALKSAKIDIVGGDTKFFDQIASSVTLGKRIERFLEHSPAAQQVKDTFFAGNGDAFAEQVKKVVGALGVSTEDVKNLTLAAALAKVAGLTKDSSLVAQATQLLGRVKELGVGEERVGKYM